MPNMSPSCTSSFENLLEQLAHAPGVVKLQMQIVDEEEEDAPDTSVRGRLGGDDPLGRRGGAAPSRW